MKPISIEAAERFIAKRRSATGLNSDIEIARIIHERNSFTIISILWLMLLFSRSKFENLSDWWVVFPILGMIMLLYLLDQMCTAAKIRRLFDATASKSLDELRGLPDSVFNPPATDHSENV